MAYLTHGKCMICGKNFKTMVNSGMPVPSLCDECQQKDINKKRREHFHSLDGLTIEERLRKIEEWIYDYKSYREPIF